MRRLDLTLKNMRDGSIFFFILVLAMSLFVPALRIDEKEASAIIFSPTYLLPNPNFAVTGDWDCNDNSVKTVKSISDESPALVLSLGDIQHKKKNTTKTAASLECWLQIVNPIDERMKIVLGDEDVNPRPLLQQYMNHFNLTKQYYSFDYQNIHFLIMGTEIPFQTVSSQFNFVNQDLSKAESNPNIDWIIVALHKTLYSSPSNIRKEYQTPLSVTYHPLFDKYGVDLVIQGHVHGYERSDPINYNPKSYSKPIIKDSQTNNYVNPEGPIFVTVGTAGATLHKFEGKKPFIVTQYSGFGFLNVKATTNNNNTKTMNAQFYANDDDSTEDQFSITKSDMNRISENASGVTSSSASSFYKYEPYLRLFGNNYFDIPNSSSLRLTNFSIAAWFNTSNEHFNSSAFIVNKGGSGNDTEGHNMNYGLFMNPSGHLGSVFETRDGTKFSLNSPLRQNNGQWHYAVATFDGSEMRLYVDGILDSSRQIQSGNVSTNIVPDNTGVQPVRIGSNSLKLSNHFIGNIDEVRIWSIALTPQQVFDAYRKGLFNATGQVAYLSSNGSKAFN